MAKTKIKTRLNGKHEWTWKVSLGDTICKFKSKFSEVYGIEINKIKLTLDGDVLKDNQTLASADVEDDVMIDVLVITDKSQFLS